MRNYFKKFLICALLSVIPFSLSSHVAANMTTEEIIDYSISHPSVSKHVQKLANGLKLAETDCGKYSEPIRSIYLCLQQIKCLSTFLCEINRGDAREVVDVYQKVCDLVQKVIETPKVVGTSYDSLYRRLKSDLIGLRDNYLVFTIHDSGYISCSTDLWWAYYEYYYPHIKSTCEEILALS